METRKGKQEGMVKELGGETLPFKHGSKEREFFSSCWNVISDLFQSSFNEKWCCPKDNCSGLVIEWWTRTNSKYKLFPHLLGGKGKKLWLCVEENYRQSSGLFFFVYGLAHLYLQDVRGWSVIMSCRSQSEVKSVTKKRTNERMKAQRTWKESLSFLLCTWN